MSGPVDVLAVLNDLTADMGTAPGTTGHQVAQVRAAVAELIAEARGAYAALDALLAVGGRPGLRGAVYGKTTLGNTRVGLGAAIARAEGETPAAWIDRRQGGAA